MAKINWRKKGADKALNTEKMNEEKLQPEEEQPQTEPEQPEQETAEQAEPHEATAEEWEAALRTAVAQRDEYLNLAQRTQADFANFRRRNQTARTDAHDEGVRETLAAFLPVLDNLERALATVAPDDDSPLVGGLKMVLRQFHSVGEKLGLEEIPSNPGDAFDPEVHNAVMRGEEGEPGTIIECFEKGYKVKDRVIRYASVKVCAE
ncbi:MAG: nucleotide exchange factor GrpE [Clostridia bacterium]|nr:nucleotide exchange factor GrpE [Clostridia bacterium]MBQ4085672.1 nucleotide exchange factor GrpE [Clostridia bacterium]